MDRCLAPLSLLVSLPFALGVFAQEAPQLEAVPEPPALPERLQSGETIDPDVTIVRGEKQTVMEYRVAGQLRAVKVIPDVGAPYYLVDSDGDGLLEEKRHPLGSDVLVNQWVIFSW